MFHVARERPVIVEERNWCFGDGAETFMLSGFPLRMLALWWCLAAAMAAAVAGDGATIMEVVAADPEDAHGRRLMIRGVVTLAVAQRSDFAVQEKDIGIWATVYNVPTDSAARAARERLKPGDEVEVTGTIDQGGYAPRLLVEDLQIIGHKPLPEAAAADLSRLFRGGDNCRRMELEGVVHAIRNVDRHLEMIVDVDYRRILVRVAKDAFHGNAAELVDATVRFTGVTAAMRNTRGEFLCPSLWVGEPDGIVILQPPPTGAFDSAFVDLENLARYRQEPLPRHRMRTAGTVSLSLPGQFLYLQQGQHGIRVQTRAAERFEPGDRVEVVGFLDIGRQIAGITESQVRKVGRDDPPRPEQITPDEINAINVGARARGVIASPSDYDGCLIGFRAKLVEIKSPKAGPCQLVLSSGDSTLPALLEREAFAPLAGLQPGSELNVRGVMQLQLLGDEGLRSVASDPVVQQMSLLLRTADDVVLVRAPSWWTPGRLASLLTGVVAGLAAVIVWAVLLRRRVRSTTLRLTSEIQSRRNAAVEFQATLRERNRLAANLHDTLLQTLRGIDFQLGACRAYGEQPDENPGEHLEVARKMVNHAAEELRGSVWALRTAPVVGGSFAQSLESIARQVGHSRAEHISVRTAGEPFRLPQFVTGNLLLVAQEALTNAITHADAAQIDVLARFDAASAAVELSIHDDGAGFTLGGQTGPDQGHFGLTGMRERIERLGGTCTFETGPGLGTTVRVKVHKRDYDVQIDIGDA